MALVSRRVSLDGTPQRIVGADNMPHRVMLHNASKSSNEYVFIGGSTATAGTALGMHIDPAQTIYVDLAPNDELWAVSDPHDIDVMVLDMRRND